MPFTVNFSTSVYNPPSDYDNLLTLTISAQQLGVNANPSPVWFECTEVLGADAPGPGAGVRDPQFHDILYLWEFDDAANATPVTPLNMPNAWKDVNKGYGRQACHVFNDAGTYTVRCTAYEPATRRFGFAETEVVINDANTVFAGDKTIVFDPDGTGPGLYPTGANIITTDWAAVLSARSAKGETDCRILLAPQTLTTGALSWIESPSWSNIRVGGLDPANRPLVNCRMHESNNLIEDRLNMCTELMLYDLDLQGPWDSTREVGLLNNVFRAQKGSDFNDRYILCTHRTKWDGFTALQGARATNASARVWNVHSDTEVTNWQDYGLFVRGGSAGKVAVIGCSSHQHEDALSGGPKNGLYNNHGPLRHSGSAYLFVSVCDLFSRNGWSPGGTGPDGLSVTADQAAMRINTNGVEGFFAYVDRVAAEGAIWMEEQGSTNTDNPGNYVLDKVLQVQGSRGRDAILCRYGGTTMRNLLSVNLNLPPAQNRTPTELLFASNTRGSANNDAEVALYNATLIDFRDDTHGPETYVPYTSGDTAFSTVTVENNVLVRPNKNGTDTSDEPLDLTTPLAGFTPRHKGPRYNFMHQEGKISGTVTGSGGTLPEIPYAQITETRYNKGKVDNGAATDQAYWQTIAASDTAHKIRINGETNYHAENGDIAVTFGPTGVTITNNSGTDWVDGQSWRLRLDRSSLIPDFDPQYSSIGQLVPEGTPQDGSAALDGGDNGSKAYDDFAGKERPATGNEAGAFLAP